jgi:hypothetical protein
MKRINKEKKLKGRKEGRTKRKLNMNKRRINRKEKKRKRERNKRVKETNSKDFPVKDKKPTVFRPTGLLRLLFQFSFVRRVLRTDYASINAAGHEPQSFGSSLHLLT